MYKFGKKSQERLETCHADLQKILNEVIKIYDFSVLEGERTLEQQQEYFKEGKSKLDGINKKSKHQSKPSLAVDIAPFPIDWNDTKRFYFLAGLVIAKANELGIKIRWGGSWNGSFDFKQNKFNDLPHFELV
jgi:peptidoglycan L-alanyl-D-glutamate endopeptidase CwlK